MHVCMCAHTNLKEWINIAINVKPAKLTVGFCGCVQSNLFLQNKKTDILHLIT